MEPSSPCVCAPRPSREWKFAELLADDRVRTRWQKVRRFFFLRESTYDITSRCDIHCDGCYYFVGDKQHTRDNRDPEAWQALMRREKARGITFAVLAGAEPSLAPELCRICCDAIPLGVVATNGLRPVDPAIGYRIHISVWGNDATSRRTRRAEAMLERQLANYRDDPRAVFVYTFTRRNIDEAPEVLATLAPHGARITFNVFSAPVGYRGDLRHSRTSLRRMGRMMAELLAAYPRQVLYSPYNIAVHSHDLGLHDLFGCAYPRRNPSRDLGLGRSFRQYRTDLQWDRQAACCVPDTDCADCRHYAAGSAVVTARLFRHATDPDTFGAWLDYVDTYLAVWVAGYEKGENLVDHPVAPPGHRLAPMDPEIR